MKKNAVHLAMDALFKTTYECSESIKVVIITLKIQIIIGLFIFHRTNIWLLNYSPTQRQCHNTKLQTNDEQYII